MIKPSQRKSPKKAPLFQTHNKLASRKNRNRRLTTAGILSAIISLVLWLFGVPLFSHVVAVLFAFIIGFAFPVKKATDWALQTIAKNVGLSYQTALEYDDSDPYAFSEALEKQANNSLRSLHVAPLRRWWLPLLVVAFGLTLLPLSPFRNAPRVLGLPDALNPLTGTQATESESSSSTPDTQTDSPNPQEPNDQAEPQAAEAGAPQTLDDTAGASGQGLNDISENVADQETLDRFLDNLRERDIPQESETQPPPQSTPQQRPTQGEAGEEGEPQEQAGSEGENPENGAESGTDPQEDPNGQNADSSTENSEGENPEGGDSAEQSGDPQDAQSQEQGAPSEGDQSDSNGPSEADPDASAQDGSDGIGNLPSGSRPSDGLDEEAQSEPEFLEGQLDQGQSNLAGTVRLPGDSDQEAGNFGSAASGFQRAEEQAVTEGSIPIEYQEIIRNYFR